MALAGRWKKIGEVALGVGLSGLALFLLYRFELALYAYWAPLAFPIPAWILIRALLDFRAYLFWLPEPGEPGRIRLRWATERADKFVTGILYKDKLTGRSIEIPMLHVGHEAKELVFAEEGARVWKDGAALTASERERLFADIEKILTARGYWLTLLSAEETDRRKAELLTVEETIALSERLERAVRAGSSADELHELRERYRRRIIHERNGGASHE